MINPETGPREPKENIEIPEDSGKKYRDQLAKELREIRNEPESEPSKARDEVSWRLKKLREEHLSGYYNESYDSARIKHLAKREAKEFDSKPEKEKQEIKEKAKNQLYAYVIDRKTIDRLFESMDALIDSGMIRDDLEASRKPGFSFHDDVLVNLDPRLYKTDQILEKYNELIKSFRGARDDIIMGHSSWAEELFAGPNEARIPDTLIEQDVIGISKVQGGYSERHPEYKKQRENNWRDFIKQFERTPEEVKEWEREQEEADRHRRELIEKEKQEKDPYIQAYKSKYGTAEKGGEALDKKEVVRRSYASLAQCVEELSRIYESNRGFIDSYISKDTRRDFFTQDFFKFLASLDEVHKYGIVKKLLERSLEADSPAESFSPLLWASKFEKGDSLTFDILRGGKETAEGFIAQKPDMVLIAPNAAFLPALIGREIVENQKVQEVFGLPENYNPYLFYPKTKTFLELMRESIGDPKLLRPGLDAWSDFDLLIDKFDSPEDISDGKNKILERFYPYRDYYREPKIEERETTMSSKRLKTVYKEMISMAGAMEKRLKKAGTGKLKIAVFDEAKFSGATARALKHMVEGAVKILLKKGIIESEDGIAIIGSHYPFGEHKTQFPSIYLSENELNKKNRSLIKPNKILFQFGKSVGRMIAEQMSTEVEFQKRQKANK